MYVFSRFFCCIKKCIVRAFMGWLVDGIKCYYSMKPIFGASHQYKKMMFIPQFFCQRKNIKYAYSDQRIIKYSLDWTINHISWLKISNTITRFDTSSIFWFFTKKSRYFLKKSARIWNKNTHIFLCVLRLSFNLLNNCGSHVQQLLPQ